MINKEQLKKLAREIIIRVEEAEKQLNSSIDWYNITHEESGLTYWEWIEQAEKDLLNAIDLIEDDQTILDNQADYIDRCNGSLKPVNITLYKVKKLLRCISNTIRNSNK